mmetsp:Transcript_37567/g.78654  ORF Transcript_37567/g.78654 Transcript_37567/m.78654 type:complete len:211 (-) Transcript_37567:141-773(-)
MPPRLSGGRRVLPSSDSLMRMRKNRRGKPAPQNSACLTRLLRRIAKRPVRLSSALSTIRRPRTTSGSRRGWPSSAQPRPPKPLERMRPRSRPGWTGSRATWRSPPPAPPRRARRAPFPPRCRRRTTRRSRSGWSALAPLRPTPPQPARRARSAAAAAAVAMKVAARRRTKRCCRKPLLSAAAARRRMGGHAATPRKTLATAARKEEAEAR